MPIVSVAHTVFLIPNLLLVELLRVTMCVCELYSIVFFSHFVISDSDLSRWHYKTFEF